MCMRFSSMLQGVCGVTGTGMPCFCQGKGSRAEAAGGDSSSSCWGQPPEHKVAAYKQQRGGAELPSLATSNVSSQQEDHLDGHIRGTGGLARERPRARRGLQNTSRPSRAIAHLCQLQLQGGAFPELGSSTGGADTGTEVSSSTERSAARPGLMLCQDGTAHRSPPPGAGTRVTA